MSKFSFYPSSSNTSRSTSPDLPFPEPLPRSDFLAADFDPSTYLSSLGHRHQTLDDLRNDLRSRSQLLNQELLDLVNSHYEEFLSLGGSVKGGGEKVEEVKLGLMGFHREVGGVRDKVLAREVEVEKLLNEKKTVRREIATGRRLVEREERLTRLEHKLMLGDRQNVKMGNEAEDETSSDESSVGSEREDANEEQTEGADMLARLRRRTKEFRAIERLGTSVGREHPLIQAQQFRMMRIRNTLLLDVGTASKQKNEAPDNERLLQIMKLYRSLDASNEAVSAMKTLTLR